MKVNGETLTKPQFYIARARSHFISIASSQYIADTTPASTHDSHNESRSNSGCRLKIVAVGESGVGKTSLLYRMLNNSSLHTSYIPTMETNLMKATRRFKGGEILGSTQSIVNVEVHLWDSGLFRDSEALRNHSTIDPSYLQGADVVLLCYAIDNRESFNSLVSWIRALYELTEGWKVTMILVGLRSDIDRPYLTDSQKKSQRFPGWRRVTQLEATEFALFHGIPFIECTAALGWFCDDVLSTAIFHHLRVNAL